MSAYNYVFQSSLARPVETEERNQQSTSSIKCRIMSIIKVKTINEQVECFERV